MRNIRLTVEYDGTDFVGWQVQRDGRSVQGAIEDALARMTGERPRLRGSGRTDAGVHARGQVANFLTSTAIPIDAFRKGLNALLPRDVAVIDAAEAPASFDARRDARGKRYAYRIWNHQTRSPLEERTSWHVRSALDLNAMNAAARPLLGEHDFAAFASADEGGSTVRILRRLVAVRRGAVVEVEAEATAFLRHMVRVLVGTLVAAGRGEISAHDVAAMLASRDRARAPATAPPQGLSLAEVYY